MTLWEYKDKVRTKIKAIVVFKRIIQVDPSTNSSRTDRLEAQGGLAPDCQLAYARSAEMCRTRSGCSEFFDLDRYI